MKTFKIYLNKKYLVSPKFSAAQAAHALAGLVSTSDVAYDPINDKVIVLEANNGKFHKLFEECDQPKHMQHDFEDVGVGEGSYTAFAYMEKAS